MSTPSRTGDDLRARLAAVLAQHAPRSAWESGEDYRHCIGYGCSCGWGSAGGHDLPAHRAHVADALADAIRTDEALVKTMAEALDHHGTIASLGLPADEFDCCARAALDAITGSKS